MLVSGSQRLEVPFITFSGFGSFPVNMVTDLSLLAFARVVSDFSQECLTSLVWHYIQVGSALLNFTQEMAPSAEGEEECLCPALTPLPIDICA